MPDTRKVPVCVCADDRRSCPYHGDNPTAHDTYAEHCRARVPGTPAHSGGRCPLCDTEVTMPDTRDELADAIREAHDEHAESGREGCWCNAGKMADTVLASGVLDNIRADRGK